MKSLFRTVKSRVVFILVVFAAVIALLFFAFSYSLMASFSQRTVVLSTEFNLQLVAAAIQQDWIEVTALANWCGNSSNLPARYFQSAYTPSAAVQAFNRVHEEYRNNRASKYVFRLVIANRDISRIIHTGTSSTSVTSLLTPETLAPIYQRELADSARFYGIEPDLLSRAETDVVIFQSPVLRSVSVEPIGVVYLAVSTGIITDKLAGYHLADDSQLYLTLNDQVYRIDGRGFVLVEPDFGETLEPLDYVASPGTVAQNIITPEGERAVMVSCPVREGIVLTQVSKSVGLDPFTTGWGAILAWMVVLIAVLALLIIFMLNRSISKPVTLLKNKIDAIGQGDFSCEPGIESESEIGEVGKGVNRLASEVLALMDSRVADEQSKLELEYRMLQSQINPHFIYNTLNSIKWMATLQKADGIAEMTTALSRLLKTVSKDIRKVVPLRDEIALLDDYVLIQKYRYGGSISYSRHVEDDRLLACKIPRFVLQPLMENAVFHGIEPKGAGKVALEVLQDGPDILIRLTDNGVGMSPEAIQQVLAPQEPPGDNAPLQHVGIHSVHQRVRNVFGPPYGLAITSEKGSYTTMEIRIPRGEEDTALDEEA